MKAKLIVNPVAGRDAALEYLPVINRRLRDKAGALDIVITVAAGDAVTVAQQAVTDGYDHLFVAGGDGTFNEVLNGVAQLPGGLQAVTFGVIPLGTGNDFATALGLPDDPEAAVQMLVEGERLCVDVGRLNDRYFVNVSAGGFIAEVSDAVNPQLKTLAGRLAYLIGGAQVLLDFEPVRGRLSKVCREDGEGDEAILNLHAFAVCNSRLVGGGRLIAPYALIDDGLLDLCLIEAMPTIEFVNLLRRISNGDHVEDERVTYQRVRQVELTFDRPIKVNTDGQVLETDRCCYEVLAGAAHFLGDKAAAAGVSARPDTS